MKSRLHKCSALKTLISRTWGASRGESLLQGEDVGETPISVSFVAKTMYLSVRTNRCHFPLPWRGNVVRPLARHFCLSSEYRALPVCRTNVQSIIGRASLQPRLHRHLLS